MYLQLESIGRCVKLSALRKSLSSLPKTLDETYERILQNLDLIDQLEDAVQALRWLCFSVHPLSLMEMIEILAIQNGEEGGFFPEDRLPDPADIVTVCSSFISRNFEEQIDERSGESNDGSSTSSISDVDLAQDDVKQRVQSQVRLAHFSVKEFLLSERCSLRSEFEAQKCHIMIAEGCIRYLLHLSEREENLTEEIVEQHPLAHYAARYWWQHAQKIDRISNCAVPELALRLMSRQSRSLLAWVKISDMDFPSLEDEQNLRLRIADLPKPLYYAASIKITKIVKDILQQTTSINARSGNFDYALHAAAAYGHDEVVQMLVDAGADINAESKYFGTALEIASLKGHPGTVRILLDAEFDIKNSEVRGSALEAAVGVGSENTSPNDRMCILRMLLDAGTDYNTQSAALNDATRYEDVLDVLLKTSVDTESTGRFENTPLQTAVF